MSSAFKSYFRISECLWPAVLWGMSWLWRHSDIHIQDGNSTLSLFSQIKNREYQDPTYKLNPLPTLKHDRYHFAVNTFLDPQEVEMSVDDWVYLYSSLPQIHWFSEATAHMEEAGILIFPENTRTLLYQEQAMWIFQSPSRTENISLFVLN